MMEEVACWFDHREENLAIEALQAQRREILSRLKRDQDLLAKAEADLAALHLPRT